MLDQRIISHPIVYGTISSWLGKKAEGEHTHEWVCYVRGLNEEDLSYIIDKVVFGLHSSFTDPNREVKTHPFVIHERGWGQFEILIKIYLKGNYESPLVVNHMLKLYPTNNQSTPMNKKPVVHEQQDEIVLVNPSQYMIQQYELMKSSYAEKQQWQPQQQEENFESASAISEEQPVTAAQYLKNMSGNFYVFDADDHVKKLQNALNLLNNEILVEQRKKNQILDEEIQNLESELQQLQQSHHNHPSVQ